MVCPILPIGADGFAAVQGVAAIGVTLSAVLVALVYMFGELIGNPRLLAWAKTELMDVIMTGFITVLIFAAIEGFGTVTADMATLGTVPVGSYITADQPMYCAADSYLQNLGGRTYSNLLNLRTTIGGYEKAASENLWKCQWFCLLGGAGVSKSPNSGLYNDIGMLSMFFQGAVASHLAVMFQIYTLRYIYSGAGLLALFMPVGIVLRSLPFVRGLGGALIALTVAMYIFYPLMLVIDGIIIGNVTGGYGASAPLSYLDPIFYLSAVFLPAINFMVIGALTYTLSGVLGEEIDISRLSQMV